MNREIKNKLLEFAKEYRKISNTLFNIANKQTPNEIQDMKKISEHNFKLANKMLDLKTEIMNIDKYGIDSTSLKPLEANIMITGEIETKQKRRFLNELAKMRKTSKFISFDKFVYRQLILRDD